MITLAHTKAICPTTNKHGVTTLSPLKDYDGDRFDMYGGSMFSDEFLHIMKSGNTENHMVASMAMTNVLMVSNIKDAIIPRVTSNVKHSLSNKVMCTKFYIVKGREEAFGKVSDYMAIEVASATSNDEYKYILFKKTDFVWSFTTSKCGMSIVSLHHNHSHHGLIIIPNSKVVCITKASMVHSGDDSDDSFLYFNSVLA